MRTPTAICLKRIRKEISVYSKNDFKFEHFQLSNDSDNILNWYFIINNLDDPNYKGGEYVGKLNLSWNYPFEAPTIEMITPSGRFETFKKICTTFTNFHQAEYSSAWKVDTILTAFVSFFLDAKDINGIGYINSTDVQKKSFAISSKNFNENNDIYNKFFT